MSTPRALKRALYSIPIDRVEDPTLESIFREKQRELSLQLDLLGDRGTSRFLHTGTALYGAVDTPLVDMAHDLMTRIPPGATQRARHERSVPATSLGRRCRRDRELSAGRSERGCHR